MPKKTAPAKPKRRATKERKPAAKKARASRVLEAVAKGKKASTIAKNEGLSTSQINRILRSEECQQIVINFTNLRYDYLGSLFDRGLAEIEKAFSATTETRPSRWGDSGGGPDHYARLAAFGHLVKALTAGRPKPVPATDEPSRMPTLQELEAKYGT